MRKFLLLGILVFLTAVPLSIVVASSQQAYQDYLYQFDRYRQTYSDFQRAKDTYFKYRSLTSQTAAVSAAQTMMTQRNLLLRGYLLFLNEKLNEDQGLGGSAKQQYQGNIQEELTFLETQNQHIAGLTSIDEATSTSKLLETHYVPLQITIRQTIIGISLGKLSALARAFDQNFQTAQTLVSANADVLAPEKISVVNRWLAQIQNTRSLYQQKIDEIESFAATSFTRVTILSDIDQKLADISKKFTEAQQLLTQETSYLGEVVTALQYK
jgi:DNA repair ATPase RecN